MINLRRKKIIVLGILGIAIATGAVFAYNGYFGGGASIPSDTMTRGLVGYWPMDEGAGQTANDASGNGNNGTLTNDPSWTTGKKGGALNFDGNGDYINAGNDASLRPTTTISWEFWLKSSSSPGTLYSYLSNGYSYSNKQGLLIYSQSSSDKLNFRLGNGTVFGTVTSALPTGSEWTHWMGTYDGSTMKMYRNGVLEASQISLSGPISYTGTGNFWIGAVGVGIYGTIDDVRIYNRALSAEEVRYHYNRGGPVAEWKFNEGSGTTAYDSTDNNNDGAITNATWTTGKHSSALSFNGTSSVVSAGNVSDSVQTASFWMKPTTSTTFVLEFNGSQNITLSSGTLQASTSTAIYVDGKLSSTVPDLNWHYVTVISSAVNASAVNIGKVGANYFTGVMDDMRLYNYARSPDEIRLDYNAGLAAKFGPSGKTCSQDPASCATEGLVGSWNFDEGTGQTANDSSGSGNTGTLGASFSVGTDDPSWTTGKKGGAFSFDGVDDYVDAGNDSSLTGKDHTIEMWVKSSNTQINTGLFSKGYLDGITLNAGSGTVEGLGVYVMNGGASAVYNAFFPSDTWIHLTLVVEQTTFRVYKNAERISPDSGSETFSGDPSNSNTLRIGDWFNGILSNFSGSVDDVRIYNRALSAEEVRYHYNRGGPVAEWKFNEGSGTTAYDSTDNNNDGTITNATWTTGKHSSALSFNGTSSVVSAGNVSDSVQTASFWMKPTTSTTSVLEFNGSQNITLSSGTVQASTSTAIYVDGKLSSTVPDLNWHYVTVISSAVNASAVNIGKVGANYFTGVMDDIRFYNYARTSDEIRLDYNAGFAARFGPSGKTCSQDPASCATEGLVGYWNLDEGTGQTANDSSGSSNTGTLGASFSVGTDDPKWTTGKKGGALSFDGVDDYVNILDSNSLDIGGATFGDSELTISAWIYPLSNSGTIVSKWRNYQMELKAGIGTLMFRQAGNTAGTVVIPQNQWSYVAITMKGVAGADNELKFYINGALDTTVAWAQDYGANTQPLTIGSDVTLANYFPGSIDDVRIYNRALSAEEVRYHYNRGGPVAEWKFNEGSGTTAYDSTDNNNDGTLNLGTGGNTTTSNAWVAGKYGSALDFDGTDDYVDAGNDASLDFAGLNDITISLWVKPNIVSGAVVRPLISKGGYDSGTYYLDTYNGNFRWQIGGATLKSVDATPYVNKWVFLTIDQNSTSQNFYINGVLKSTDTNNLMEGDPYYVRIGSRSSPNYFSGSIDDVRIYNYARTSSQILQDYNNGMATFLK